MQTLPISKLAINNAPKQHTGEQGSKIIELERNKKEESLVCKSLTGVEQQAEGPGKEQAAQQRIG